MYAIGHYQGGIDCLKGPSDCVVTLDSKPIRLFFNLELLLQANEPFFVEASHTHTRVCVLQESL